MDVLLQHADLVTHSLDLAAGGPVRHVTDVILRLLVEESGERHDGGSLLQTGGEVLPSVIEPRSHGSESHKKRIMEILSSRPLSSPHVSTSVVTSLH